MAELTPTEAAGHATELAREAVAAGADLILVLGGDGTINEVANGMIPSRVPLGILPGGTANVLANELGLGNSPGTRHRPPRPVPGTPHLRGQTLHPVRRARVISS